MARYYDDFVLPPELRRSFSVYDRLIGLGVELGGPADDGPLSAQRIASVVFTESGLVHLSGGASGHPSLDDGDASVASAYEAGSAIANRHLAHLHRALTCGDEEADLDAVLYPVKVLGMVVSPVDRPFLRAPEVVNGYSSRWHSVFGGSLSVHARDGVDPGGFGGMHARSAIAGFDGRFALECEVIVAIPAELARLIIARRGWLYPLPDVIKARLDPPPGTEREANP